MPNQRDRVVARLIEDEMKQSFLDYSMSVIVQRALPDVRDGLKPVHRRILYAMHEAGLSPARPHKKSATVVGDVLGKYHPHGDSAVYDAMVRMVQDFSLRYPLVLGQGNFGSIDGDSAAAYRYTEVRLSSLATELLDDLEKETVAFVPNFDDRLQEPLVLPARAPNLLINGSSGIAVGMSTNMPPHNLREVVAAALHLLDHPECSIADLMGFVPGPDFPTGGLIVGRDGIEKAYHTGRGRVIMQGRIGLETRRGGREQLVVTEIPYATSKTRIIEQIADLTKKGRAPDIADLRDESDRDGVRLVIELKRGADARKVVRALLRWTALQSTFGVINLALEGGVPREFNLKELLERFRDHRIEMIVRRSRWERERALEEAHILEGLLIALQQIEKVISIVRGSRRRDTAAEKLRKEFKLSERQAEAILRMRLYRLTQLEQRELRDRLAALQARIRELDALLADPQVQLAELRRELIELEARYGDRRRTRIVDGKPESMIEAMVAQEEVVVLVSHQGFAKQIPMYLYRRRLATGKPVMDMERHEDDYLEHLFSASTADPLLFFTSAGQAYSAVVSEIPEAEHSSRGRSLGQLLGMEKDDHLCTFLSLARHASQGWLLFVTERGMVKRTRIDLFGSYRAGGVNAINLREGDRLLHVHPSDNTRDLLLISRAGRVIRFPEDEVTEMGRAAQGVRGMKLAEGDRIVGSVLVRREGAFCAISERGYGRQLQLADFEAQRRDGRGAVAFAVDVATGRLAGARELAAGEDLMLLTAKGAFLRLHAEEIPPGSPGEPLEPVASLETGDLIRTITGMAGPREVGEGDGTPEPDEGDDLGDGESGESAEGGESEEVEPKLEEEAETVGTIAGGGASDSGETAPPAPGEGAQRSRAPNRQYDLLGD